MPEHPGPNAVICSTMTPRGLSSCIHVSSTPPSPPKLLVQPMSLPYNKFHSARFQRQAPAPSEVLSERVDEDDTGSRLSQALRMLGTPTRSSNASTRAARRRTFRPRRTKLVRTASVLAALP